jgi:hypothetical protein
MSKTATATSTTGTGQTQLSRVEHPHSPYIPLRTPHTTEFRAEHGNVKNTTRNTKTPQAECQAKVTDVAGYFNEMVFRVSKATAQNSYSFITVGGSLKELPNLNPDQLKQALKTDFWSSRLTHAGSQGQTRRHFVECQLSKLAEAVSKAPEGTPESVRKQLKGLLDNTMHTIGHRLALEISLLDEPLAEKITARRKN